MFNKKKKEIKSPITVTTYEVIEDGKTTGLKYKLYYPKSCYPNIFLTEEEFEAFKKEINK